MSGSEAPKVPEIVSEQLNDLNPVQQEMMPQIMALHKRSLGLLARDVGGELGLKAGKEIVSNTSVNVDDAGKQYRVRLFAAKKRREPFNEIATTTGLRFLATDGESETKVMDIELDDSTKALLIGEGDGGESLPEAVNFFKTTLNSLGAKIADKEKAALDKRQRRSKLIRRTGRKVGAVGASIASIGAAGYFIPWGDIGNGIGYLFENNVSRFDDNNYKLADGNIGAAGQVINPAFSYQLFNNRTLTEKKVPRVDKVDDHRHYSGHWTYPYDGKLKMTSGLREFVLDQHKQCRFSPIRGYELGSKVVAWTDYLQPNGQSGATDVDIELENTSPASGPIIRACWDGPHNLNSIHPRVVFKLIPPPKLRN